MKLREIALIFILSIGQGFGCEIIDPTYDYVFKNLFGQNGPVVDGITGEQRLISFLNSILGKKPFSIHISSLEYLNLDTMNASGNRIIFDIRCVCKKEEGKEIEYNLDIKMQRVSQSDYFTRITNYSSQLLNESRNEHKGKTKVIIISILDCTLPGCEEDVIFQTGTFKTTVLSFSKKAKTPKLVDDTMLHVGIQLPLYAQKVQEKGMQKPYDNEWLRLLASRRIDHQINSQRIEGGKYNSNLKPNQTEVKSALKLLNNYATNTTSHLNEAIARFDREFIDLNKELAIKDQQLQAARRKVRKNTLISDIKRFNKGHKDKRPKSVGEKKHKFAKELKGMNREDIENLLKPKQRNKAEAYLKALFSENASFEEKSMDEDF